MSEPRRQRSGVTGRPEGQWARLARMIAICLCAGVIINVAVAWGLAARLPHTVLSYAFEQVTRPRDTTPEGVVQVQSFRRVGMDRREWSYANSNGDYGPWLLYRKLAWTTAWHSTTRSAWEPGVQIEARRWGLHRRFVNVGTQQAFHGVDDARGWPMLAMWCELYQDPTLVRATGGVPLSRSDTHIAEFRALPWRIIWTGFVGNSAVYGGALLILWMSMLVARERRRLWRGYCPMCGFDLHHRLAECCPQCGDRLDARMDHAEGPQRATSGRGGISAGARRTASHPRGAARPIACLRIALTCVCIAVVINVGVSWALAAWLPHKRLSHLAHIRRLENLPRRSAVFLDSFARIGMERREWTVYARELWVPSELDSALGPVSVWVSAFRAVSLEYGPHPKRWGTCDLYLESNAPPALHTIEDARGWPILSLWCELYQQPATVGVSGGVPISIAGTTIDEFRALPYRPIWRGFLGNTTLYTVAILIPWMLAFGVCDWNRLRHGRCPHCAYDLRFDLASGCPECGWRREGAQGSQSVTIERGAAT